MRTLFCFLLLVNIAVSGKPLVAHTLVALCDNENQGIVPVPAKLGDGRNLRDNLYWGALYGVKTHFKKSKNWKLISSEKLNDTLLERVIFKHKHSDFYMVADAYAGEHIFEATVDYFNSLAGEKKDSVGYENKQGKTVILPLASGADMVNYIGHDGLMDFDLSRYPESKDGRARETIVLACISKDFFKEGIQKAKGEPLVWTTGLMAPEAYVLHDALEKWVLYRSSGSKEKDKKEVREAAARAYNKYQKCGLKGARRLLVQGF
jgi:hypothetical protein